MNRHNNHDWLDDALAQAIGAEKPESDFDKWQQDHPEAVRMLTSRVGRPRSAMTGPLRIRSIIMKSPIVKIAAAAVVVLLAAVGISQLLRPDNGSPIDFGPVVGGPMTITFPDGSRVTLAQDAKIKSVDAKDQRGFEHITGLIDVTVAKGQTPFIVTTPYGTVKALGTKFAMDIVDAVAADSSEKVQLLAVKVTEGSVEVSNPQGSRMLKQHQELVVQMNQAPYDFAQDEKLPAQLRKRIQAMFDAFKAGDAKAYLVNYNVRMIYDFAKGKLTYDDIKDKFGGDQADAERLRKAFASVGSPEHLTEAMLGGVNIAKPAKAYLQSVELSQDGEHAKSVLVVFKSENSVVKSTPQWHYFDNDWWQTDD